MEYVVSSRFSRRCARQKLIPFRSFSYSSCRKENVQALQKLNVSLLFNFLELVDVLLQDPTGYSPKVENIRQIMYSMHHLINSFRPAQARASALTLLGQQLSRRQALLKTVNEAITNADAILGKASEKLRTAHAASAAALAAISPPPAADQLNSSLNASMEIDVPAENQATNSRSSKVSASFAFARTGIRRIHEQMLAMSQPSSSSSNGDAMDVS